MAIPAAILKAPFADQVAFFRGKLGNLVPTRTWTDLMKSQHDNAFMVAGAMKADLLADLADAVDQAISQGIGIGEFRRQFDAIVERHGWSYRGEHDWRTRVIYQTNLSTSYAAGRLAQLKTGGFPYWLYKHSDSVTHPRPLHVSWDGLVLPAGDPWWQTHYPPNGWGCKCRVVGVRDARMAKRLGGKMTAKAPDDGVVPGTDRPNGIDKGWDYMPGASLQRETAKQAKAKAKKLPKALAQPLQANIDMAKSIDRYALPAYEPAKTVKAAERLAQKILATPSPVDYQVDPASGAPLVRFRHGGAYHSRAVHHEKVRQTIYGQAKYTGLDLDTANALNQALLQAQAECDRLGIPRLRSVKTGAGRALASMGDGVLSVSKNLRASGQALQPGKYNDIRRDSPLADKPHNTERYFDTQAERFMNVVWHEFGHHIHQQYRVMDPSAYKAPPLEASLTKFVADRRGKLNIPSQYAATNSKEFFAESYNLYKQGRSDLIDPDLIPFIEAIETGKLP